MNEKGKFNTVSERKILLVDDNPDLLQILQIILKGHGYQTVTAGGVDEAVAKIRIHNPCLILLDVCLADQDGREFCQMLKLNPETEHIRVILMSGLDESLGLKDNIYGDDFMQKPFDYNDLISRVEVQFSARETDYADI